MNYTPKQIIKNIDRLNAELDTIYKKENKLSIITLSLEENFDLVSPTYDFDGLYLKKQGICDEIIKLKHALNTFNNSQKLDNGYTIDQCLIMLPLLKKQADFLKKLNEHEEREPVSSYSKTLIEYEYANYDKDLIEEKYKEVSKNIVEIQNNLDYINNTSQIEI